MMSQFTKGPFGGLSYGGIVHVAVPRGHSFAGRHVADVQEVAPDGRSVRVSLHLDDDHPAVQDALGDGIVDSPDQAEWIADVPVQWVTIENGRLPFSELVAPALRRQEAIERARAEREERAQAERNKDEYRAGRGAKLDLSDLDASNVERHRAVLEP